LTAVDSQVPILFYGGSSLAVAPLQMMFGTGKIMGVSTSFI
jgi:hypothetical protein